jgi:hypothetical protein
MGDSAVVRANTVAMTISIDAGPKHLWAGKAGPLSVAYTCRNGNTSCTNEWASRSCQALGSLDHLRTIKVSEPLVDRKANQDDFLFLLT